MIQQINICNSLSQIQFKKNLILIIKILKIQNKQFSPKLVKYIFFVK
jgi:hypothetical protein